MIKDFIIEYGAPVAVALTLSVGGMAIKNSKDIAVIESEKAMIVDLQRETIKEVKDLSKAVYRLEAKLEVEGNEPRQ